MVHEDGARIFLKGHLTLCDIPFHLAALSDLDFESSCITFKPCVTLCKNGKNKNNSFPHDAQEERRPFMRTGHVHP